MAACGEPGEDASLYETVHAVGKELCPRSESRFPSARTPCPLKTSWGEKSVVAPVSLIISAFCAVKDVRKTLTPALVTEGSTNVVVAHRSGWRPQSPRRLRADTGVQRTGQEPPDLDDPQRLLDLTAAMAQLRTANLVLAYHDRSDGGLFATLG